MQKCHHFLNRSLLRAEPKKMHVVNCKEIQAIPAWHPFHSEFNLICKNHPFFEITKNVFNTDWFPSTILYPVKFTQHHFNGSY